MFETKGREKLRNRIRQMLATLAPNDFEKQCWILQQILQETEKGKYYRTKLTQHYSTRWKAHAQESLEEICKELSLELCRFSQLNLFETCV